MAQGAGSYNFVPIKEIRDGVVVLKNGGLRGVLLVTPINLGLKSSEEQEATIMQFQNFLNTLDFDAQIVIQSRRMDIRPYLKLLEGRILVQKEELLRVQTRTYIEYIKWFTDQYDIMKKHFFVVVPYSSELGTKRKKGLIDKIFGTGSATQRSTRTGRKKVMKEQAEKFDQQRSQLEQRMSVARSGLSSMGLRAEYLNTEALIDLYYGLYNPGDTQKTITGAINMDSNDMV